MIEHVEKRATFVSLLICLKPGTFYRLAHIVIRLYLYVEINRSLMVTGLYDKQGIVIVIL